MTGTGQRRSELPWFAERLSAAHNALRAAATPAWSNGQAEGQFTRLKLIERQMYGRANLDLLERRFLLVGQCIIARRYK